MDMPVPFLTVLTPTYNRAKELPKLAASLDAQSQKGFQWLVIDDGSVDNTEAFIQSLRPDGYEIEYHRKENGGKHTALNYSHPFIKGEYVCIVDSDDYLTPDAVESICQAIEKYGSNQKIACYSFPRAWGGERTFGKEISERAAYI